MKPSRSADFADFSQKYIFYIFFRTHFDVTSAQRASEKCTAMGATAQFAVAHIEYPI